IECAVDIVGDVYGSRRARVVEGDGAGGIAGTVDDGGASGRGAVVEVDGAGGGDGCVRGVAVVVEGEGAAVRDIGGAGAAGIAGVVAERHGPAVRDGGDADEVGVDDGEGAAGADGDGALNGSGGV